MRTRRPERLRCLVLLGLPGIGCNLSTVALFILNLSRWGRGLSRRDLARCALLWACSLLLLEAQGALGERLRGVLVFVDLLRLDDLELGFGFGGRCLLGSFVW